MELGQRAHSVRRRPFAALSAASQSVVPLGERTQECVNYPVSAPLQPSLFSNSVAMVLERLVSTELGMEPGVGVFSLGSEHKALAVP